MRTRAATLGAGSAGFFLESTLHAQGLDDVVIERPDRPHIKDCLRPGSIEPNTADAMRPLRLPDHVDLSGWWFTDMNGSDPRIQIAELDCLRRSEAAWRSLVGNHAGLPISPRAA